MTPTLYIVLRTDVNSMSPGKAAAQASHAANDFELSLRLMANGMVKSSIWEAVAIWREDRSFGRCLVLGGDELIFKSLKYAAGMNERNPTQPTQFLCGVVIDPTYPVSDGNVTHLVPFETAFWAFLPDNAGNIAANITELNSSSVDHSLCSILYNRKLY